MSEPNLKSYPGSDITVMFDGGRCLHFAECVRGLPEVFDVSARPWIAPDNAAAAALAAVVERCPSGALQYTRHDGGVEETPPDPTVVTTNERGQILLHGNLTFTGPGTQPHPRYRMTLCACGRSAQRPFCDNACRST
ncbi:hypothetical protein AFR_12250 [Actinoplanes friuliensis DSM 7358]|uniref:Iron-binding zinc finger CDGSH type domain-containing protein n=2 Tax=Actinoplanes friuliensis TaxID=196914 RepID=U5VYK3_9ACTN|nr:hypothetical protein AFR_12250 [Actinoplanes friuliensis DSM 7358]